MDGRALLRGVVARPLLLALLLSAFAVGCSTREPGENPGPPVPPAQADLATPEAAVRSYLGWISYAYRTANSDAASQTMTPYEGVRVDSYIQLNREKGEALDQALETFTVRSLSSKGDTATLAATEEWRYRYFSTSTGLYTAPERTASYETTYTVVRQPDGRWLVERVRAKPLTPLE